MPSAFTLASASDTIHIWDVQGDKPSSALSQLIAPAHPSRTIHSHAKTVHALQWNHNNGVLASGSSDGSIALSGVADGKLVMRLPLGADVSSSSQQQRAVDPVAALAFSSGSRYLLSAGGLSAGGAGGSGSGGGAVVTIHDLKKHDKSRRLLGHTGAVTALDFGASDQHVASCSVNGDIIVHNLALASLACKLVSPAVASGGAGGGGGGGGVALRDLQHSPHKKHLLGACGDSGVVELWDVNTSALMATLRPPNSIAGGGSGSASLPLSALRFSPTSSALFASVGLDKRLCFYDANSKKCIRDISTDYPLTCVDYHSDGCTLVLGTMSGHLLLYDIRNAGKPTAKILNAHTGRPVHSVKFTHPERETAATKGAGAAAATTAAAAATAAAAKSSASGASSMYDNKATAFIDTTNHSGPSARQTSASAPHPSHPSQSHAHNSTLPASHLNHTTLSNTSHLGTMTQNQTVPVGVGAGSAGGGAGSGDLFSPIKDATHAHSSARSASPFGLPSTRVGSMAHGSNTSSAGLGFMSPIGSSSSSSDRNVMASPVDSRGPPSHLTASSYPAAAAAPGRPSHLSASPSPSPSPSSSSSSSPPRPGRAQAPGSFDPHSSPSLGRSSAAASSAAAFALHALPSPAPASSASASRATGGSAMQQLLASPQRRGGYSAMDDSASASAAPSIHFDDVGGLGSGGSGAGSGGGGGGGHLSEHHVSLLRSMLDSSLYELRSELRSQVSDLHVEMLKQFHQSQLEQARAMDAFTGRFERMLQEVKELRDEYKQLKHIY